MVLVPDANRRGVWKSTESRRAGVHAVIIGVSDYPYLGDGSAPPAERAPDNGGLRQLEVCARTAARIFHWLNQAGSAAGAPLATVRLLLAPRADEKADVDTLTGGAYAPADFATIRGAIEDWADDIVAGNIVGGPNVAFFFFSGHGTEYMSSPALLASDILNPRSAGAARKAIGFLSLCAVKTLGIDRALFFVDACRDVPGVARALNIVGEEILRPNPFPPRIHDSLICLQSTRTGGSAFQEPGDSATIFGRAVLEGLEGPPPSHLPYDTSTAPWRLVFGRLECHVKQRVRELVAAQTATRFQQVVPYGDPYDGDMLVAEKLRPRGPEAFGIPPVAASPSLDAVIATRSDEMLRNFSTLGADAIAPLRLPLRNGVAARGDLADFGVMHQILRHESITDPWVETLRILDVESEQPVEPEVVTLSRGRSEEVAGSLTAWVDVAVAPGQGAVWVSAGGRPASFAVVLPRDIQSPMPVRLDLSFRLGTRQLEAMAARVGDPDTVGVARERVAWPELWRIQRIEGLTDLGQAGMAARDLVLMQGVLADKVSSPVAAAISTTVLLRCGNLSQLHDWPRSLADWFGLPDGPLLWAETLLRRDERARGYELPQRSLPLRSARESILDDTPALRALAERPAFEEARRYFAMLADRGPPLLGACLGMAARQAPFWRRILGAGVVQDQEYRDLQDACSVVDVAAGYAVSDGLFAGFAAADRVLAPHEVLGQRRRGYLGAAATVPPRSAAAV